MSNTFCMTEIVLSVPGLGIPPPNSDGSTSMSGEHITAHVYAVKGNERLLVGRRDFVGMTTSGHHCSLTVIKPEGHQLVVETVDKYGPRNGTSRVRLCSEKEEKSANDWHLNKSGTIQSASIGSIIKSGHSEELIALQRVIEQATTDAIHNALKPGGLLFNRGR